MTRNIVLTAIAFVSCFALQGCWVYSVNSVAELDGIVTYEPALVGTWTQEETPCTLKIEAGGYERYALTYAAGPAGSGDCLTDGGTTLTLLGRLVRIGTMLFLEVQPRTAVEHMLPLISFYRVELDRDQLVLRAINADWLEKEIKEGRIDLPARIDGGEISTVLLTASSDRLREFLSRYGDEEEVFPLLKELTFERSRVE